MRNKVKVISSHYLHIYQPHGPTVRGKDCSKRPGFKTSSVRLGRVMRRSTLGFFSVLISFRIWNCTLCAYSGVKDILCSLRPLWCLSITKSMDWNVKRREHRSMPVGIFYYMITLTQSQGCGVLTLYITMLLGAKRVLNCGVIKMTFLKLWDLSGYSERTMAKRPTCQKWTFWVDSNKV